MPRTPSNSAVSNRRLTPPKPLDSASGDALDTAVLRRAMEDWLLDCQLRQHSPRTIESYRSIAERLLWFVDHRKESSVGTPQLRAFMLYLSEGHTQSGGRWGNPKLTKPLKAISIQDYCRTLKAFFNWLVADGILEESPLRRIKVPIARLEQKQPIAPEHVTALLQAAKRSTDAKRNEALLLLLLDTGLRASELCSLKIEDVDLAARSFKVAGKGNKIRACYFGRATLKALSPYLRSRRAEPSEPLFAARSGGALTANGLRQLTDRLAVSAGVPASQCGPHAFRRTFAVSILRAGANVFTVQAMLGHTDLEMTRRYVSVADADVEAQHRQFSPVDRLRSRS